MHTTIHHVEDKKTTKEAEWIQAQGHLHQKRSTAIGKKKQAAGTRETSIDGCASSDYPQQHDESSEKNLFESNKNKISNKN